MSKKQVKITTWVAAIICIVLYGYTQANYIRGTFPKRFGLVEVQENIYSSDDLTIEELTTLDSAVTFAVERNINFWGEELAAPKTVFCSSPELYQKFGPPNPDVIAIAIFLPYGNHVVIGNNALEGDVLAHEFCHAYFFEKLKPLPWSKLTFVTPTWFEEGLAMQVESNLNQVLADYEKASGKENFPVPLGRMDADNEFYRPDSVYWNALTACYEVNQWLNQVGQEGLTELIENVGIGGDFEEEYQRIFSE